MSHDGEASFVPEGAQVKQEERLIRVKDAEGRELSWMLEIGRNGNDTVVVARGAREPRGGDGISDAPTEFDLYTATSNNNDEAAALREALIDLYERMSTDGYSEIK